MALPMFGEQGRLQVRAESFNAFNTPRFGRPNRLTPGDSNAPRAGEIRSLPGPMRIFHPALNVYF